MAFIGKAEITNDAAVVNKILTDFRNKYWQKYGGLEVSEMRRLRQLEEENRRLKSIVADQALDIRALKDVLAKNGYGPR